MKSISIPILAVTIAVFGNVALADDAPGIPDEIIKELGSLVGTWEVQGTVGDKTQTGGFTCRWAQSKEKRKCCLIGKFSYTTGDELTSGMTLIGWNAAKKCIEDRGFDAQGGNATLLWTVKSPTLWRGDITMVRGGEEIKATADLVKKDNGDFVYEAEMDNGEVASLVFTKVSKERRKKANE